MNYGISSTSSTSWMPNRAIEIGGNTTTVSIESVFGTKALVMPNLPKIVDVKEYNKTVVIVTFSDQTQEKAVLQPPDVFSLEQGISICVTKWLLRSYSQKGKESSAYNRLIKNGLKVYERKQADEKRRKDEENRKKEEYLTREQKAKEKRAAARQREAEEAINIHKEAYLKAIKELSKELKTSGGTPNEDH